MRLNHSIPQSARQAGVTLIEMLITMGLLVIFLIITITLFTSAIDTSNNSSGYNAVVSDGRFVQARLDYDIARASAITTPASLGTIGTSLAMTVGGSTYTYALNGSMLQLTDGTGTANLNSDGSQISALSFQRLGNTGGKDTIRYSFTITAVAKGTNGADTQTLTSTVERR